MMKPLRVRIFLSRPAVITRLLTLDRLVAAVLFGRAVRSHKYDRALLREIFREENGVFAASVFYVETPVLYFPRHIILSPPASREYYSRIGGRINDSIWAGTGSGAWRSFLTRYVSFYTSCIYFYTYADRDKLYDILRRVRTIGKKGQFGFGSVKGVEIEEVKEDKSILLNDYTPSRPLPVDRGVKTGRVILYNMKGPAWDRSGLEPCVIPPLSLKEEVNVAPEEPVYHLETISATEFTSRYHSEVLGKKAYKLKNLIVSNRDASACAVCGIIHDRVVRPGGTRDISRLASGSFTDFRSINFQTGNCLCEYCARALAYSWTTTRPTLITPPGIKKPEKKGRGGAYGPLLGLISNPPEGEYIYLHHRGNQKHLLVGSLPSISPSIVAVNYPEHTVNFIDLSLLCRAAHRLKEHPEFKNLWHRTGEDVEARIDYNLSINPEHAGLLFCMSQEALKEVQNVCHEN